MKKNGKKLIALLLSFAMVFTTLPAAVFADTAKTTEVELPEYIFSEKWNEGYDVLYHEADKVYTYKGQTVKFENKNTVTVGTEQHKIKNAVVKPVVNVKDNTVEIKLPELDTPVGLISGEWNSQDEAEFEYLFEGNVIRSEKDSTVSNRKWLVGNRKLVLKDVSAGVHTLTSGSIYEKCKYGSGHNFNDGEGNVTSRNFGYLPDITFEIKGETPQSQYTDGVYEGVGDGNNGKIKVKVTIKDGKIVDVEEVSQKETPDRWELAKALFKSIVEKNSTNVDTVTTATRSCNGIIDAVNDALRKAENGGNNEEQVPEEQGYLGVKIAPEVPKSFTNDLWTQYDFKEMKVGDTAKLNPRRVEEATVDKINNDIQMPHFNYEIIRGDSVTIDDKDNAHAIVKAVKNGDTVVKITYDELVHANENVDFPACDPVNTAYVVYSVGGNQNITVKDNIVYGADQIKNGEKIFRSYDTVYYKDGDTVPFDLKVSQTGAEKLEVFCNGLPVQGSNGQYTLPLENRSNIIQMTATAEDGTKRSLYRVLDARKIKVNIENKTNPKQPLRVGDVAKVSFTGITMPVYKLATIYNPCFGGNSTHVYYENNGKKFEGHCGQWDLDTRNSFEVKLDKEGNYLFNQGKIRCDWWGSPLGADKEQDNPGAPNMGAPVLGDYFSVMPDFSFNVEAGIKAESVNLNKTEVSLVKGAKETLVATVLPETATDKTVKWSSDDETIAKVNQKGEVTAVATGKTKITATSGTASATCTVNVTKPVLKEISMRNNDVVSIYEGKTHQLSVVYNPENIEEADKGVLWSSSNQDIVTVDKAGKITGVKPGKAIITAISEVNPVLQTSCFVEIKSFAIKKLELNKTSATIKQGSSLKLNATVTPEILAQDIAFVWESSNEAVAVVSSDGMVIPMKEGIADITVRANGKSAKCKVTVEKGKGATVTAKVDKSETIYSGDKVKVTLKGLEVPERERTYDDNYLTYDSTMPGASSLTTEKQAHENLFPNGTLPEELTFVFSIPENIPSGTYFLSNGVYTGESFRFIQGRPMQFSWQYEGELPLLKFTVVNKAEEAAKLEKAKNEAKAELQNYKDLAAYRPVERDQLKAILKEANVENAKNKDELAELVKNIKAKLDAVKTDAQLTEIEAQNPAKPEVNKVTVYFTLSKNNELVYKDELIARVPVEVGYFDLADYGLEKFTKKDNNGKIIEEPTLLHAYIRFIEKYYNEGKKVTVPSSGLNPTGNPESIWLEDFFGHHGGNLLYYVNHKYAEMEPGIGATADWIIVNENDVVDVELSDDMMFFMSNAFTHFDKENVEAVENNNIELTLSGTIGDMGTTSHTISMEGAELIYSADGGKTWNNLENVTDKNGKVNIKFDKAGEYIVANKTAGKADGNVIENFAVGICKVVVKKAPAKLDRLEGINRYETSLKAANALKEQLGIEKFDTIVVATGADYADALSGTYLAQKNNAPMLLVDTINSKDAMSYIKDNLSEDGKVYLLGGKGVIPESFETLLKEFKVTRLGGANRYETNIEILRAAEVNAEELLVCTGNDFADSLSASATGKPILLVDKQLSKQQKEYLGTIKPESLYLIGGKGAIGNTVSAELIDYTGVKIQRIAGINRYETSVKVAQRFFGNNVTNIVLAYAQNFPDGISAGPLARQLKGPLLLVDNNNIIDVQKYLENIELSKVVVLGGKTLISDEAMNKLLK